MENEHIINSGQLESYCLGHLSHEEAKVITQLAFHNPEIRHEIDQIMRTIESLPKQSIPNPTLKAKVLDFLRQHLHPELIDLASPPLLNQYSDAVSWSKAVQSFDFFDDNSNLQVQQIYHSADKELNLIWLHNEILEDAHADDQFKESFFILEGECECDFEGIIVRFKAGDYFEVPPNTKHSIRNISEHGHYVKGLVQRISA